jgi:hypothetical protein
MIATAVLAAEYAGTLDLHDVTTLRWRVTQEISATPGVAATGLQSGLDLVMAPTASIHLSDRRSAYTLSYSPTLTLPDLQLGLQPQILHFAGAVAEWHGRFTSFTVTEAAMYGQLNSAFLYQPPTMPGEQPLLRPIARAQTITIGGSTTDATIGERVGRRVRLSLAGGYIVSGGVDTASQAELPKQYGPRASTTFDYTLSRRDDLITRVIAQEISTTGQCPPPATTICHERVDSIRADETLRRRLAHTTTLSFSGGLAVYDIDASGGQQTILYPVAIASLSYRFASRGTSELAFFAQLAPNVDPRTGLASEYLQGSANLIDRVTSSLMLHVGVSGLRTVQTSDLYPVTILTGSVDTTFRLDRLIDLTTGVQGLWQDQAAYGTLVSLFAYVALTVRAPPTRF